jgi:hypothetical protein
VVTEVESLYIACGAAAAASLFQHEDSAFYFVRYVAGRRPAPDDNLVCAGYFDQYVWFPQGRIRSATLTGQADQALAAGNVSRAETLYRDAVAADDTNARSRLGMAAALSRGASWAAAKSAFSKWTKRTCLPLAPDDAGDRIAALDDRFAEMSDFDAESYDAWRDDLAGAFACADPP